MEVFQALPLRKRRCMELLFRNCTEEVKYYMTLLDIEAGRTFIKAGADCTHIFIILSGKVTYVGRTSMEVRLDTYVEHLENGMRQPINRAYFTMVAMDENDQPRTVPRLILETESDRADWEAAEKRREMRMRRKEEGF